MIPWWVPAIIWAAVVAVAGWMAYDVARPCRCDLCKQERARGGSVSEESNLEQIKERWGRRRKALPEAAGDIDRLIGEVEQLRDEVFELKIYRGFGLDHGHERCAAEIKRLTEELGQARTNWARSSPEYEAGITWAEGRHPAAGAGEEG